jgi:hypothetical protein
MPSPDKPTQLVTRPINASREDLLARYIGIQLTKRPSPGEPPTEPAVEGPKVLLPNQIIIGSKDSEIRVATVGHCIYCIPSSCHPYTADALTEEHIVARGWGGTIILQDSCCTKCQKHINEEIEGVLLGSTFLALRRRLKIRGRKRKRPEERYEIRTIVNGKPVIRHLSLDEHPTILLLVSFNAPIAIGGIGGPAIIYAHQFDSYKAATDQGLDNIFSRGLDTVRFSQMLAKIAHGYACWRIGTDKFRPKLQEFILRKFQKDEQYPECYELVGGDPRICAPSEPDVLHQLGHSYVERNGRKLLVVGIRLLANLSGPLYLVVAGEML